MINLKIRINVDEQTFTLPVDTQFVPGIPEKDPVVMVPDGSICVEEEMAMQNSPKLNTKPHKPEVRQ